MKRVAINSNKYEDDRARFKHQTLVQDFMELQQETEAARNNLLALKQKKLTLQAEVRFLRRRHKFLLQNKSTPLQERVFMNMQPTLFIKSKKEKARIEKHKTLHVLPPVGIAKQRVRVNGPKGSPKHMFGSQEYVGQGQSQILKPVIDLNQISREEEELQDKCEPIESLTQGLIKKC